MKTSLPPHISLEGLKSVASDWGSYFHPLIRKITLTPLPRRPSEKNWRFVLSFRLQKKNSDTRILIDQLTDDRINGWIFDDLLLCYSVKPSKDIGWLWRIETTTEKDIKGIVLFEERRERKQSQVIREARAFFEDYKKRHPDEKKEDAAYSDEMKDHMSMVHERLFGTPKAYSPETLSSYLNRRP